MSDSHKETRKVNNCIFKGYRFKFEGFPPNEVEEYEKIAKVLGAKVKKKADYTFSNNCNGDGKFYSINYLLESLKAEKPLDIEKYRIFEQPQCPNGSKKCYRATPLLQDDSLYHFYDEDVFCELCLKEFKEDLSSDTSEASEQTHPFHEHSSPLVFELSSSDEELKNPKKFKASNDENMVTNFIHTTHKVCTIHPSEVKNNKQNMFNESNLSDENNDLPRFDNEWWLPKKIPKKYRCTIYLCTLEPDDHFKHGSYARNLNLVEMKVLLKYLIQTNFMQRATSLKAYRNMIDAGYLTHRTVETLRNCFRRRILPNIHEYMLPIQIEEKFKACSRMIK